MLSGELMFYLDYKNLEKRKNRQQDIKQTHKDLDKNYGKSISAHLEIILVSIQVIPLKLL